MSRMLSVSTLEARLRQSMRADRADPSRRIDAETISTSNRTVGLAMALADRTAETFEQVLVRLADPMEAS